VISVLFHFPLYVNIKPSPLDKGLKQAVHLL
jgi:hypothetical protein